MRQGCHSIGSELRKQVLRGLIALSLITGPLLASASPPSVALVYEGDQQHTREFIDAFTARLEAADSPVELIAVNLGETPATTLNDRLNGTSTIVVLGGEHSDLIAGSQADTPLLSCMISLESYRKAEQLRQHTHHTVHLIDQPLDRMVGLVKVIMGSERDSLAVIAGKSSHRDIPRIETLSHEHGYRLQSLSLGSDLDLRTALDSAAAKSQVMLLLPDSSVLNRTTAKSIFMSAYLNKVALFGYSPSMAKAGALAVVYSSPMQLGFECAEDAIELTTGKGRPEPVMRYPETFDIAINYRIARLLRIDIDDKETIHNRLVEESKIE